MYAYTIAFIRFVVVVHKFTLRIVIVPLTILIKELKPETLQRKSIL